MHTLRGSWCMVDVCQGRGLSATSLHTETAPPGYVSRRIAKSQMRHNQGPHIVALASRGAQPHPRQRQGGGAGQSAGGPHARAPAGARAAGRVPEGRCRQGLPRATAGHPAEPLLTGQDVGSCAVTQHTEPPSLHSSPHTMPSLCLCRSFHGTNPFRRQWWLAILTQLPLAQ